MQKIIDLLKILLLLSYIIFSGCASSLKNGKTYIVEDVKGSGYVVKFKGLDELFTVPDKLKKGDTVKVYRVFRESKATIY